MDTSRLEKNSYILQSGLKINSGGAVWDSNLGVRLGVEKVSRLSLSPTIVGSQLKFYQQQIFKLVIICDMIKGNASDVGNIDFESG